MLLKAIRGYSQRYLMLYKIIFGYSIILSVIVIILFSVFNTLDSDKFGIVYFTHPPLLIYLYFLIKSFISGVKRPHKQDEFLNFMLLSTIAMLLPLYSLYLYLTHRAFDILILVCLYFVFLWLINWLFFILESEKTSNVDSLDDKKI